MRFPNSFNNLWEKVPGCCIRIGGLLLVATMAISCQPQAPLEEGELIARYNDIPLYRKELEFFLPPDLSPEDSARFAKGYIEEWTRYQAVAERAYNAIPGLAQEMEFRLKDQEHKLVDHLFASWLVDNQLDTVVSQAEIETYYERHPDMFISQTDHYGFYFVKTRNLAPYREVTLMRSNDPAELNELLEWCKENAVAYHLDSTYLPVSEIIRALAGSQPAYQNAQHKMVYNYFSTEEGERYYNFFKILGRIREGERLPLSLCIGRIKEILLNQRKNSLIEQTEADLLLKARAAGKMKMGE